MDKTAPYILAGTTGDYELGINFAGYLVRVTFKKGDHSFSGALVCEQPDFLSIYQLLASIFYKINTLLNNLILLWY